MSRWLVVLSTTALLGGFANSVGAAAGAAVTPSPAPPSQMVSEKATPQVKKDVETRVPPEISARLEQLEKNAKTYESGALLRSADEHLGKIESRLDRIGESARTIW